MKQNETKKTTKNDKKFNCDLCDFKCRHRCDYMRHIGTAKHIYEINETKKTEKTNMTDKISFDCIKCGKYFNSRTTLWRHSKKCNNTHIQITPINTIMEIVKQNNEFKELLVEQNKQNNELTKQVFELSSKATITNNTTNNNTTNNNNFNLQFFLNETCKDALNITDFINQLQIGTKDLEETGRLGYAAGISKIFINGLKQLNVNQRPVHCSDIKRETIYIKDGNQWEKDNDENTKLTNAIRDVAHKNIEQIQVWTEKHPEYSDLKSKYNDKYMVLIGEAMSGSTKEETNKNHKKIARNIMRETIILK